MKIYVMRHGETNNNLLHLISGNKETDLTKNGIFEAKKAKEYLKDKNIDIILSSPLSRARITASIVADKPIIIDKRLNERDYGEYTFKRKKDVDYNKFWNYENNINQPGESLKDLFNRIDSLITDLNQKYPDKNILLVTHSGIARAIHYYITGIPNDNDLTPLQIPNCSVRVYEIPKGVIQ